MQRCCRGLNEPYISDVFLPQSLLSKLDPFRDGFDGVEFPNRTRERMRDRAVARSDIEGHGSLIKPHHRRPRRPLKVEHPQHHVIPFGEARPYCLHPRSSSGRF